jgi:anti-sigma factor RsiW
VTSTTDTAEHPEVTELSDLTEGLLPPSRTSDLRQHLDECPLCADVYASLEEIRGMLGTLPGPPRMPADVVGRIDAALAAEALLNATAPYLDADGAPVPHDASSPVQGENGDAHVSRETSPALGRPAGHSRASTGPGRTGKKRRTRRSTVVLGSVFTAAVFGLGTLLVQSMGNDGSGDTPATTAERTVSDTFSGVKLEKKVTDLLADTKVKSSPDNGSVGVNTAPTTPGASPVSPNTFIKTDVPDCVEKAIGNSVSALAATHGVYEGEDAYLVVLADASDASRVTAYVVDASCVGKASAPAGEVLLKQSYPRA